MNKKTLFTAHPQTEREKKNLLFLNLISRLKSTSRTHLSETTDTNIVTVSNYVNNYIKKGLVAEHGYDASSGGRKRELIALNKNQVCTMGIDVGENRLKDHPKAVLMNLHAEILVQREGGLTEIPKKLLEEAKIDKEGIKKIGVTAPDASTGPSKDILRACDGIESEMSSPVLFGDRALCAAFGEKALNPDAVKQENILFIHTDEGQGVFIKGDEFYESHEEKTDFSYLKPWKSNASVTNMAKQIVEKGVGTKIVNAANGNKDEISVQTVMKAARAGDNIAVELIETAGLNLGARIAYLVNLFEPHVVIIGGGIEEAGDLFLGPLKQSMDKFILEKIANKAKIIPGILGESACVKGAAFLAIREAFIEA